MKAIIKLLFCILLMQNTYTQTIYVLPERHHIFETNYYVQDTNGLLDQYVGTWAYTSGNTSFTITLKKKIHFNTTNENEYEDIIYGAYRYVENGVEKFNSLPQLDDPTITNYYVYRIHGNYFPSPTILDDEPGNPGLVLSLIMGEVEVASGLYMFKTTVGGVEALRIYKGIEACRITIKGNPEPQETVPSGYYTLLKQ